MGIEITFRGKFNTVSIYKRVVMHLPLGPIRSSAMSPGQIYSISYAFIIQSGSYIQSENSWLQK